MGCRVKRLGKSIVCAESDAMFIVRKEKIEFGLGENKYFQHNLVIRIYTSILTDKMIN